MNLRKGGIVNITQLGHSLKGKLSPESSFQDDVIIFKKGANSESTQPWVFLFEKKCFFFIVSVLLLSCFYLIDFNFENDKALLQKSYNPVPWITYWALYIAPNNHSICYRQAQEPLGLHGSGDPERDFLYSESWNKLATVFLPFGNRPEWHTPVRRMWLPNSHRPGDHEALSRV